MDPGSQIEMLKRGFRRKFTNSAGVKDPVGLRAVWDQLWASALDTVEITGNSFEGGGTTGVMRMDRACGLIAAESVLSEEGWERPIDAPSNHHLADFRQAFLQT